MRLSSLWWLIIRTSRKNRTIKLILSLQTKTSFVKIFSLNAATGIFTKEKWGFEIWEAHFSSKNHSRFFFQNKNFKTGSWPERFLIIMCLSNAKKKETVTVMLWYYKLFYEALVSGFYSQIMYLRDGPRCASISSPPLFFIFDSRQRYRRLDIWKSQQTLGMRLDVLTKKARSKGGGALLNEFLVMMGR